jgi:hypothetical protein
VEGEWRVSGGLGAPYTHREPFASYGNLQIYLVNIF